MKPRILFISTPRSIGGGEVYLANLLPELKHDFDCTVLGTPSILNLINKDATTHRIILFPKSIEKILRRNYRLKKIYYTLFFKRYFSKHSYDIVNLQEFDGAFVESINFGKVMLTEQTRLFITGHLRDWAKNCLEKMSAIVCVSSQTLRDVTDLGVDESKCLVVHNAVDVQRFKPTANAGRFIDWVGRVEEEDKNPLLFIQIAEAAQAHGFDYQFRLIGGGRALRKIQDYIKDHHINNVVVMGPKSSSELIDIYKETKVLCMTSRNEGLPYVALEVMACGKPVVATDVGGMSEIINSRSVGRLVKGFDEWKFLDEIKGLMEDEAQYKKIGQAARERVEKSFSLDKQVNAMKTLYASIVEEG